MRPDGSQVVRVVQGEQPAWSPDGKQIAFAWTQDHGNHRYIYLMDSDGSGVVRLTDDASKESYPSWSPDGHCIVFHSFDGSAGRLCVFCVDSNNLQCFDLADFANVGQPTWSPDGSQIAISARVDGEQDNEIFVVSTECIGIAGGCEPSVVRLTDNEVRDDQQAWSPDGKQIAFARWSEPGEIAWANIWVMDADGKNAVRLTNGDVNYTDPDWSPDGKKIVFVESAIYLVAMNRDGSDATHLTESGWVKVKGEDTTLPIGSWDPDWWGIPAGGSP
jgi:TolB protein